MASERDLSLVLVFEGSELLSTANPKLELEDGDSFWLGNLRVRFYGIDAVESGQDCQITEDITCYSRARETLQTLLEQNRPIRCTVRPGKRGKPKMSYGRYVAQCASAERPDGINRKMIEKGFAFADEKRSNPEYAALEKSAAANGIGVHAHIVEHPAEFRRRNRKDEVTDTELLNLLRERWMSLAEELKEVFRALIRG